MQLLQIQSRTAVPTRTPRLVEVQSCWLPVYSWFHNVAETSVDGLAARARLHHPPGACPSEARKHLLLRAPLSSRTEWEDCSTKYKSFKHVGRTISVLTNNRLLGVEEVLSFLQQSDSWRTHALIPSMHMMPCALFVCGWEDRMKRRLHISKRSILVGRR